jgi:hypothetical protein
MTFLEYLQYNWMFVIPYSLLAITGIIFSILFLGRKKSFAIFSLTGYIMSLLFWWVFNYLQFSVSDYSTGIVITFMILGLIGDIFLFVAIFTSRKEVQKVQPYPYGVPQPPPSYGTAAQVVASQYPFPPQTPQQPPVSPQPQQDSQPPQPPVVPREACCLDVYFNLQKLICRLKF